MLEPADSTETSNLRQTPTANSVLSGSLFGMPVAVVAVWYLNTYVWPNQMPIEVATAAGSVISTVISSVWHLASQLLRRFGLTLEE